MLEIIGSTPLLLLSLTYLVCLAAYGFIEGRDDTPVYLAFMICAFVGVSFAHARIGSVV
jgi:hypothetical protein